MARLGLGYEVIAKANPRIIYVGAFGFDQQGPYAAKPAYDDLIQGSVGVPSLVKRAGSDVPRYVPTNFADRAVGQRMANVVTAALYCRERTGKGQAIEVPMFETMIEFVMGDHLSGLTYEPAAGPSGYPRLLAAERKPYATADGYICAVVYNDKHWQSFLALIGRPEMFKEDVRFSSMSNRTKHINDVYGFLADVLKTRSTSEWLELLNTADIPVMPMHSVESLLEDPHLNAIDFFKHVDHPTVGKIRMMSIPTRWSESQLSVRRHAPELGEQSVEILREIGYDEATIQQMIDNQVISQYSGKH
jgi:crotonobetainyl-CoA:carnitine CoA-transferase CaiB-like acyl-CoA transferase